MMPQGEADNKKLFSELIKKQMLVLGPDITLAKVRNVPGLSVDASGEVQKIEGEPQVLLQALINQFVELSGMIVKKTMESILTSYPSMAGIAVGGIGLGTAPIASAVSTPAVDSVPAVVNTGVPVMSAPEASTAAQIVAPAPSTPAPEPPPMSAMNLESLSGGPAKEKKEEAAPVGFSSQEMADLNKALEELSKAPLSTENSPSAQPAHASV